MDARRGKVCLNFSHRGSHSRYYLGVTISPSQWDNSQKKVINHPSRNEINITLNSMLSRAQTILMALQLSTPTGAMTSAQIRDYVIGKMLQVEEGEKIAADFVNGFRDFLDTKHDRTRESYECTLRKILGYDPHPSFQKIDRAWLDGFRASFPLSRSGDISTNYQNIHLRNLRAYYNYVRDVCARDIPYPFKGYRIVNIETIKRDLSVEQLRKIMRYPVSEVDKPYLDMFILNFLLIGINVKDMHKLTPGDYSGGRIKYSRSKTKKPYSIKVEPEAKEIISRYKGDNKLLSICERFASPRDFNKRLNSVLHKVGEELRLPMILTTYYARYTWSTLAYNDLQISQDYIADALGHSNGNRVTSGYIQRRQRITDKVNRMMIDYVIYDRLPENIL